MLATVRLLAVCATVFAALVLTLDGSARAFQPAAVLNDIDEVVKLLQEKKVDRAAIAKRVAAIQKKNDDLNDLMAIYKPTKSKGLGWNPAKKGPGDGIEKRFIDLGKKELTKARLAEEKGHVVRAAYYSLALAEITEAYVPGKWAGGKLATVWREQNAEVKGGSAQSLAAVEANDLAALKKAMTRINSGCSGCHALFRPLESDLAELVELLRGNKVDRVKVDGIVAMMKEKYGLEDIMAKVYKPTKREGIGYDPAMKRQGDGIERRIIDLGTKRELTPDQLQAEKNLLIRAAYYNLAMHEIAKAYAPAKPVRGKGAKAWNKHNDEVGAGTKEMIDAVKANDPKALKKAMGKIGAACNGCHTDFRN